VAKVPGERCAIKILFQLLAWRDRPTTAPARQSLLQVPAQRTAFESRSWYRSWFGTSHPVRRPFANGTASVGVIDW
jgi:hypothetical protein